jgi:hypothetical protein
MSKCEICGGSGYHKLSCPTQKVTFWYDRTRLLKPKWRLITRCERDLSTRQLNFKSDMTMIISNLQELISKEANVVTEEDLKRMRRCKNHVWRKHYLNGGKVCQVCGKAKEIPTRNKDVEE